MKRINNATYWPHLIAAKMAQVVPRKGLSGNIYIYRLRKKGSFAVKTDRICEEPEVVVLTNDCESSYVQIQNSLKGT